MKRKRKIKITLNQEGKHWWSLWVERERFFYGWKCIGGCAMYDTGFIKDRLENYREMYPDAEFTDNTTTFAEMSTPEYLKREELQEKLQKNWDRMTWDLKQFKAVTETYKKNRAITAQILKTKHMILERAIHHARKTKAEIALI